MVIDIFHFSSFFCFFFAAGVNDAVENAVELAELLHEWGRNYHVNLIPFNPIEGSEYRRPYKKAVCSLLPHQCLITSL